MSDDKGTILYIDDNETNLEFVRRILIRHGYSCFVTTSASDGLQKSLELLPDLILLDIQMPEMNGFEVLKQLRKLSLLNHTKFIAATANAMDGDRKMCLDAGFDGYLAKPILKFELLKTIETYMNTAHK